MLSVKNLTKKYKNGSSYINAVDDITAHFDVGEFVFVLGASGSGKSTLLNVLCGLDTEIEGSVIVDGIDTKNFSRKDWAIYRNRYVGFVFQEYNPIEHLNVWENVALPLQFQGIPKSKAKEKALIELEKVGLIKFAYSKPNQISGGQAQRVAIARALVTDPKVIMADEPTGALDTELGNKIIGYLKKVSEERVVVVVTHDEELAEKYATRTVSLSDGKVIEDTNNTSERVIETGKLEFEQPKMKFGMIMKFAKNNIFSRMIRTLATSSVVSIGYISIFLLAFMIFGINSSLANTIGKFLPEDQYQIIGIDGQDLTDADLLNIGNLDNVDNVRYAVAESVHTENAWGTISSIILQAVPYDEALITQNADLYGRIPENDNEILIDVRTAANMRNIDMVDEDSYQYIYDLVQGQTIDLTNISVNALGLELTEDIGTYEIVGMVGEDSVFGASVVYLSYEETLRISKEIHDEEIYHATAIAYLSTTKTKDIDALTLTLRDDYNLDIVNYFSSVTSGIEDFMLGALKVFIGIASVSLIVSGILIGLVIYTSMLERIKEIGILSAIGARQSNIIGIFVAESAIIGLMSSIIATGLALLLTRLINGIFSAVIEKPLSLLSNGFIEITLLTPKLWIIGAVILFSVLYAVIAGLIPSFRASKINAVKALRRE